jgi:pyruvate/2-oxoglutarate dehydrogenase complex dihydrolipoamide acyltransferase (E2) component
MDINNNSLRTLPVQTDTYFDALNEGIARDLGVNNDDYYNALDGGAPGAAEGATFADRQAALANRQAALRARATPAVAPAVAVAPTPYDRFTGPGPYRNQDSYPDTGGPSSAKVGTYVPSEPPVKTTGFWEDTWKAIKFRAQNPGAFGLFDLAEGMYQPGTNVAPAAPAAELDNSLVVNPKQELPPKPGEGTLEGIPPLYRPNPNSLSLAEEMANAENTAALQAILAEGQQPGPPLVPRRDLPLGVTPAAPAAPPAAAPALVQRVEPPIIDVSNNPRFNFNAAAEARQEAARQEAVRQEAVRQESVRQETVRQETLAADYQAQNDADDLQRQEEEAAAAAAEDAENRRLLEEQYSSALDYMAKGGLVKRKPSETAKSLYAEKKWNYAKGGSVDRLPTDPAPTTISLVLSPSSMPESEGPSPNYNLEEEKKDFYEKKKEREDFVRTRENYNQKLKEHEEFINSRKDYESARGYAEGGLVDKLPTDPEMPPGAPLAFTPGSGVGAGQDAPTPTPNYNLKEEKKDFYAKQKEQQDIVRVSENYAEGGLVDRRPKEGKSPPNAGVADDLPRNLSEGEYVIPKHIVDHFGEKFFEDLLDTIPPPQEMRVQLKL